MIDKDAQSKRHINVLEGLLLVLILLLAIFMAYIPHLDYIYPIHIDEYIIHYSGLIMIQKMTFVKIIAQILTRKRTIVNYLNCNYFKIGNSSGFE